MDSNNWRAVQGQVQMSGQVIGGEAVPAGGMEGGDWRTQLVQDSRQRIVNKIIETLKRHLPFSGQEELQALKKIAVRFEEKIYTRATSQSDYLRKISLKMLSMEMKSQNPMANTLQSNAASNSKNPQDPASQSMHSQIQNHVQQLPIPMVSNQSQVQEQLLSQNIQNSIPSTGVPISASLTSALPSVGGMPQGTMPNVLVENPNMLNSYNQWLPQQLIMKQKLGQGGVPQSIMQSLMQQQNLLPPNQLQSSQPAVMQSSLRQTSASSTPQNQQASLPKSTQAMLQQQPQSVLRQQQQQQPQQLPVMHQQQSSMPQHPMLPTQQQLSAQQPNTANMQQYQMIVQQNNMLDAQLQRQQRIMAQQNSISNMEQQQMVSQIQSLLLQLQQQLGLQQQANILPRDLQQKIQTSGPMLQQQTTIDQQKQLLQSQRVMPEVPLTSLDSSSQTGSASAGDSLQQGQLTLPHMHATQQPQTSRLKPVLKPALITCCGNPVATTAATKPSERAFSQQQQPQISQMQTNEGQMNYQMQPMNIQGCMMSPQQSYLTNLQHNTLFLGSGVSNSRQNMLDGLQPGSNIDPGQVNALNRMQLAAMASLQQNPPFVVPSPSTSMAPSPQEVQQMLIVQKVLQQRQQQQQYQLMQQVIPQQQQHSILTSHTKAGTPLQSANPPFDVPSPSTSMAPSPMPGDSEKINSGISSVAGNNMHHPNQSLAIGTPWMSASPLLAEFTSPDGTHGDASTIVSGNSNVVEQPLKRLIKANHALEAELPEINQRLLDTVVYVSEDDVDPTAVAAAAAEGGEGTIAKCFSAVPLIGLVFWMMMLLWD